MLGSSGALIPASIGGIWKRGGGVWERGAGWWGSRAEKLEFARGYSGNLRLFMRFFGIMHRRTKTSAFFVFCFLGTCFLKVHTLGVKANHFVKSRRLQLCVFLLPFFSVPTSRWNSNFFCLFVSFVWFFFCPLSESKPSARLISIPVAAVRRLPVKRSNASPRCDARRQWRTSGPWRWK